MTTPSDIKVYCSGPMMSNGDKMEMKNIADALESYGFKTYLPQRDGIEVGKMMERAQGGPGADDFKGMTLEQAFAQIEMMKLILQRCVFATDIYQVLAGCQCAVFNMDGRVPDEGSVSEAASAYTAGKPVLVYKRDPISLIDGLDNPMVSGLSYIWQYVNEVEQIPKVLKLLIDAYEKQYPKQKEQTLPPHLAEVVALGKAVNELLATLRKPKSPDGPPSEIDLKTLMAGLGKLSAEIPPWTPFKGQHVPGLISAV